MLIRKIYVYFRSDGFLATLSLLFGAFLKHIYYTSVTVFLSKEVLACPEQKKDNAYSVSIFDSYSSVESICFPRLFLLPIKEWFSRGSKLCIVFCGKQPISFAWIHYNSYLIHDVGEVQLKPNEAWIGPTFVNHHFRGRGINKHQIVFLMNHAFQSRGSSITIVTSANQFNISSLRSFQHLGFNTIGTCVIPRGILNHKSRSFNWNDSTNKLTVIRK